METGSNVIGVSSVVKLAVDAIKLVWPTASSAVVVTTSIILSILLTSLSVLQDQPVFTATTVYAILVQSIVSFAVAVGLTEVQKKAEHKRTEAGEPKRKIG